MNAVTSLTEATQAIDKARIISALRGWIEQKPGLDPANYFSPGSSMEDWRENRRNYDTERRAIYRDLLDARTLLRAVEWRESVTADMLREAFRNAYAGRLTLNADGTLSYCTGQYFPTEYRKAACAVLSSALWAWARAGCMPSAIVKDGQQFYPSAGGRRNEVSAGEWLRDFFRREFGRNLAASWFN